MGWLSQPDAPKAPDYKGLAEQTAASSQYAQDRADWANRPTINTPWGSQTWQSKGAVDPSTGKPVTAWTQNTTLNPQAQAALDAQMQLDTGKSQLAGSFMDRVASDYSKPFDMSGLPARADALQGGPITSQIGQNLSAFGGVDDSAIKSMGGDISSGVGDASRQRIEQGLLDRLRPEQQFQTEALETKLANQGLTPGSKAYDRAKQSQGDQFSRDQFNALMMGGQEQRNQFDMARGAGEYANSQNAQGFGQQMSRAGLANSQRGQQFGEQLGAGTFGNAAQGQEFGQNLQAGNFQNQNRQQAFAEQAMQRGMSLNEMNALLTGTQIGMPQMPSFNTSAPAGSVNYSGAGNQQYNAAMNNYNAAQQGQQGLFGGLSSLAGLGLGAYGLGMFKG
jgi:hypothetical protein